MSDRPKRERAPSGVAGAPGRRGPRPDAELLAEAIARPDGWLDECRAAVSSVARRIARRAENDEAQDPLDRGIVAGLATAISSHEALMKRRGTGDAKRGLAEVTPIRKSALDATLPGKGPA